jgi:hypothetical protein
MPQHYLYPFLFLSFLSSLFFPSFGYAQVLCHTDAYYEQQVNLDPALLSRELDMNLYLEEQTIKRWHKQQAQLAEKQDASEYELVTIPVVVHLVYNNGEGIGAGANLSNERVYAAIDYLNETYRNRGLYDPASGVDTRIEFCLANKTPNGTSTDGINRALSTTWTDLIQTTEDSNLKQNIGWDRNRYLNIWVVNAIRETATSSANIAAYSSFPFQAGENYDGVVIIKDYFGTDYVSNKVLAHEIGHYLGLYHTFREGCTNNSCLGQGDFVCDTPPDALSSATSNCSPINSCISDSNDDSAVNPFRAVSLGGKGNQNDLIENYMDYSGYVCHSHFTQGQLDRMRLSLLLYRETLMNSNICQTTYTNDAGISNMAQPALFGCDNNLALRLSNFGNNTIWNVTLNYQINNGTIQSQWWNGTLAAGNSIDVLLENSLDLPQGTYNITAYTSSPNGGTDAYNGNNSYSTYFYVVQPQTLPFSDNFESSTLSDKWLLVNNDNATTWQKTWINGCWVNGGSAMQLNHLNYNESGQKDYLFTRIDLSQYANADLQFDLAYARATDSFADKLRVAVSTNCGYSFSEVYYKTGAALATVPNQTWSFSPANCEQWRNEQINLIDFAGKDIIIAFEAINFKGNNLYIDNIRINGDVDINCHPPLSISNTNVGSNSLTLNWLNYNNEAETYRLRYRPFGSANWVEIYNVLPPYTLNNLVSNTTYEVAVMSDCAGSLISNYGTTHTFTTAYDPCPAPISLTVSDVDKNFAQLTWAAPTTGVNYRFYFRMVGTAIWFGPVELSETQYLLSSLTVNTNYEVKVHSLCGTTQSAQYAHITFFTAPDCSVPAGLIATNVGTNQATLQWNGDSDASSYRIEYREVGASAWSNVLYSLNSYVLNGLQQERLYEVRVRTQCGITFSEYCDPIVFQTASPCYDPSYLHSTAQTQSSIDLSWNGNTSAAQAYRLLYKKKGVVAWDTLVVLGTSATLWGLEPCTEYLCRVKALCGNTESNNTPNLSVATYQTSGYCCAFAQSSNYLWIRRVIFAGLDNNSNNNGGFADFSTQTAYVQQGMSYSFQFRLGLTKKTDSRYWDVWIDYNKNLIFEDNEHVYSVTAASWGDITLQTGNITIPWWASTGTTKMRIALRSNEHALACGVFPSGEVEDYSITISSGKQAELNPHNTYTWQVSPNPTSNFIHLQNNNSPTDQSHQVDLYNGQGQCVFSQNLQDNAMAIDMSYLPFGIYYLNINNASGNFTSKILRIE